MSIVVTVSLSFKPELAEPFFRDVLPGLQPETRAFPGTRSVRALRDGDDALFVDVFETREAAEAYFAWRESTGALAELGTALSEPPRIRFWPEAVGDPWLVVAGSSASSEA